MSEKSSTAILDNIAAELSSLLGDPSTKLGIDVREACAELLAVLVKARFGVIVSPEDL